ncbi:MAG: YfiR family protein [Rhodoferax sp.]|nr:YfiR family protein [Rhodoferax sp.]
MLHLQRLILVTVALLWAGKAVAENSAAVRLGFLLNFTRYVEWSEVTLKPEAALRICIAPGDADMVSHHLGEMPKQLIQGRPIQIKLISRPADASGCHVLYLPAETPATTLPDWFKAARQAGALTVGDLPDMVEAGGMVGLVAVDGRYRFDINLGVACQADLRLSSQLLKLARAVK